MSLGDVLYLVALAVVPFACVLGPSVVIEMSRNRRQLRHMRRDWDADMGGEA